MSLFNRGLKAQERSLDAKIRQLSEDLGVRLRVMIVHHEDVVGPKGNRVKATTADIQYLHPRKKKAIIDSNGERAVPYWTYIIEEGSPVGCGASFCAPTDEYNKVLARLIAKGRAYKQLDEWRKIHATRERLAELRGVKLKRLKYPFGMYNLTTSSSDKEPASVIDCGCNNTCQCDDNGDWKYTLGG